MSMNNEQPWEVTVRNALDCHVTKKLASELVKIGITYDLLHFLAGPVMDEAVTDCAQRLLRGCQEQRGSLCS